MKANKQNMIAVSESAKQFVVDLCAAYPMQPGKTSPHDLTQREAVDALVAVAESVRAVEKVESDDDGNESIITVDLLDLEVRRTLALRAATVRANSATAKVEAQAKELEELRALLAKLQGETVEAPAES